MTIPPQPVQNTKTIMRNSLWYGLEVGIALVAAFVVSVTVARAVGPKDLGYYAYITWLTNISKWVGGLGIPLSTRKYMAEYLGRGEAGTARAVFFVTFRLQAMMAAAITALGLILVFTVSEPSYRIISTMLVVALFPRMTLNVPSQANMAAENMRANVPASVLNNVLTVGLVSLSLIRGWGLLGVSISMLIGHTAEFVSRSIPTVRWVRTLPPGTLPPELRSRMISYSSYGMVLMLLNILVWDRSDIFFLKMLSTDIRQVSFFSIAFNLSEKFLVIPQTFAQAVGVSVMAQFGRDQKRLLAMVSIAARYVFLCAVPLLAGAAVLSGPLMRLLYGHQYVPAIPVLAVVCILAIPKSLLLPAQHLLQSTEKQRVLVVCGLLCGVLNVVLDLLLIPRYSALGAAFANGATQLVAMIAIWAAVMKLFPLDLRWRDFGKIALSSAVMTGTLLLLLSAGLTPLWEICFGIPLGAGVFIAMLRVTASLGMSDRQRLEQLKRYLPARFAGWFEQLMNFVSPQAISAGSTH